ncbi:hypothetical protein QYE76_010041 [Lolium multiflorum]|uniref:Transposase (putative) gypsy type domain-containing protein n=1 Tax=Lolium multiflorum TaxID=4521 RepID=A0AAD8TW61_LOLMU|nr:hypothetical protein QYE76_010041 [Lolium multiflorum]
MGFAAAASEGFPYRGSHRGFATETLSRRKGNAGATRVNPSSKLLLHLLLLVGIDILTYRRYYDTPPILVGHQPFVHVVIIYLTISPSNGCVDSPHRYLRPSSSSFGTFARAAPLLFLCENSPLRPRVLCAPSLLHSSPPRLLMPPRKLTKHNAPVSKMATTDLGNNEWERSKISQQDINLLKKLGISSKQDSLRFPKEESYPRPPMEYRVSFVDHLIRGVSSPIHDFLRGLLFMYGLQLHHLTPNSILHISIFITLCESFLGVQPNWSLWIRIFLCRRNGSSSVAYNIGGVVIYVRPDVEYFDVKFPDSVQGWREKWLYIHEENHNSVEDNIPPFDGAEKICRRRSWDAEATDEEKAATEALMTRIHELQNTRGQELSGPCDCVATSSLPEGGEVEERAVVTDDNQGTSRPDSENAGSRKSAASSEKDVETEATASTHSPPPAASPKNKRKRDEVVDSVTSKADGTHAEEPAPGAGKKAIDLYEAALVNFGDEEEDAPIDATARTSTSRTLVVSEAQPDGDETSPPSTKHRASDASCEPPSSFTEEG